MASSPIVKRHKKKKKTTTTEIGKVKKTKATISDLPEEVLTEVLVRLSVKDILACVRVRKSWFSLIKTRVFITLHSHYHHHKISSSSSSKNPNYLLFRDTETGANVIRVDDINCKEYLTLEYPPDLSKHSEDDFHLVSNGLICLFDLKKRKTRPDIYLWNPVIQKYITLPRSPQRPSSCGKTWWKAIAFGFVQEINDYVVVYMAKHDCKNKPRTHYVITCVYNLCTNSWKQIVHDNTHIQRICHSESVIVNGVAIWIGHNSHKDRILVCFDTKTEMLREILSPESLNLGRRWFSSSSEPVICAFDQSIVYFVEKGDEFDEHDMWILKGDPINEFVWEKSMTRIKSKPFVRFLGLRNNGEPILHDFFDLISYNLDSHKSYILVKSWDRWCDFEDDTDEWSGFYFYKQCRACQPYIIKPFAESLGLLDID